MYSKINQTKNIIKKALKRKKDTIKNKQNKVIK